MPSPKVPKPAPPQQVAATQQQFNQQQLSGTQTAQNVNQVTPYGNLIYTPIGLGPNGVMQFQATTSLSPQQQAILNNLQTTQTGLGDTAGNLTDATSDLYSTPPDFSEAAGTQTRINMERQLEYLKPFQTQQTEQLDNQLRNQGLMPGTEAYDRAMRTLQDNQAQSVMSFLNQTQPIAFQQAQAQYMQPLQTIAGILGLTQPAGLPSNLINTPRPAMSPTDFVGANTAYNQAQMQAYQAQLAQHNAMLTGVFGLGSTFMGMPPMGSIPKI